MTDGMDLLAMNLTEAQNKHAALLATGDERAICAAYIAALEAERALLLDCTGAADAAAARELGYLIDDERKAFAAMGPSA